MNDLLVEMSRKAAYVKAKRALKDTGKPQAIYSVANGKFETRPWLMWRMMRPGRLAAVIRQRDRNLNGFFTGASRWITG